MIDLIDREMLESVVDEEDIVTLDEELLDGIRYQPLRVLLSDVGLPDRVPGWLMVDQHLMDGEVLIGGEAWQRVAEKFPNSSLDMTAWLSLGGIGYDDVAVDTASGVVYCIPESGAEPYLLNSSVEALAYFLYALEAERPNYDFDTEGEIFEEGAEDRLLTLMREADPAAMENPESTWYLVLRYVRNFLQ